MRKLSFVVVMALALCLSGTIANGQSSQDKEAARIAVREKLRNLLTASGPKKGIEITFKQSEKQEFNFVGVKRGLNNADFLEIVVVVSKDNTINFAVYPHYKGGYINVDKASDPVGLMRLLLNFNSHNFLYWGADDTRDVFAAFTFTLESGFPDQAIEVILYSMAPLDQFIAQMRPFVDAPSSTKSQ